jgi:hypothetical protein
MRRRSVLVLSAAVMLGGLAAAPALAQGSKAPTPTRADQTPPVIWNYFVLIVIAGAIFGANLIPSKRGHQD